MNVQKPFVWGLLLVLLMAALYFGLNRIERPHTHAPKDSAETGRLSAKSHSSPKPVARSVANVARSKFVPGQNLNAREWKLEGFLKPLKEIDSRVGLRVVASSPTHVSVGLTVDGATADLAELRFRVTESGELEWVDGKLEPFAKSFRRRYPEVDVSDFSALAQKQLDASGVKGQVTQSRKLWAQKPNGIATPAVAVAIEKHVERRGHYFETWIYDAGSKELLRTQNATRHPH